MDHDTLEISLGTLDERVKFSASAPEKPEITVDYYPPLGNGEGYTSLELLLVSFASCMSTTLLSLLRRMRKTVSSLEARAQGTLREEHPRALSRIDLKLALTSPDLAREDVGKALALAEEKYCPVYAMLRGNVEISVGYEIVGG